MSSVRFPLHNELKAGSRFPGWGFAGDRLRLVDLTILLGMGVCATLCVTLLDFGLRLPGHAILRAVFPMALGLALAPRRMAGLVMGSAAVATLIGLRMGAGIAPGLGAMTGLCLIGPLLDAALWRVRRGWQLYVGFACAGFTANLAAFLMRGAGKLSGVDLGATRPWTQWISIAPVSYALCGLLAGLFSAFVWFRFRSTDRDDAHSEAAV
jgi:hypothetical protein